MTNRVKIVVVESSTGRPLRTMWLPSEDDIPDNVKPGEEVVPTGEMPQDSYWDFGTSGWVAIPSRPSRRHVWDWASKAWGDVRDLPQLKLDKWEDMKVERDQRLFGTFTSGGRTFDCGERSRARIAEVAARALRATVLALGFQRAWPQADGAVVTLTRAELLQLADDLEEHTNSVFQTARSLRSQIQAATTAAEVRAITWPTS